MRCSKLGLAIGLLLVFTSQVYAAAGRCNTGPMFNVVTDPAWQDVFPIKIGNATIISGDSSLPDSGGGTANPVCTCQTSTETIVGVDVSFWDPAYLAEPVKDAYCFPTIGMSLSNLDNGW